MKKIMALLLALAIILTGCLSDSVGVTTDNINTTITNENGDTWNVGGIKLPTEEEAASVPEYVLPISNRASLKLPTAVDNSTLPFMRPVFMQKGNSCAQASAIGYIFTYEINRLRGLNSSIPANQYPTNWTYNFVNNGVDNGSWMWDGWKVGIDYGIPNAVDYGTATGYNATYWPSLFNVYKSAHANRVASYATMSVSCNAHLIALKTYLYNHGDGSSTGGLASFVAGYLGSTLKQVNGNWIFVRFGTNPDHAMTIVGYDDTIAFDWSGDGICSNNKDNNKDGQIDMQDWEIGALKIVNSGGTSWCNKGYAYMPYRLLATSQLKGGLYNNSVYVMTAQTSYTPKQVLKVKIQANQRQYIKIFAGANSFDTPRG